MTFFEARDLEKSFGGIRALDGANLEVERSELVGMIGPNGAGKTTFFNCLTGFLDVDDGAVFFRDEDVTDIKPHRLARRGMARTFQLTRVLETMTVEENLLLPAMDHPGERIVPAVTRPDGVAEREAEIEARADQLLGQFELRHLKNEYAANLSGGQRKLLEFARVLVLDPDLLMLDEPFAGVNPTLTKKLVSYIEDANESGTTILIIEHEIRTLSKLVERLVVLHDGRVIADGVPRDVLGDERVQEAYLGG